jgi:hypothetical protein
MTHLINKNNLKSEDMTTKEKEINALKALVEMDGYFAEYFKTTLKRCVKTSRMISQLK